MCDRKQVRTVVLDMDDTLYPEREYAISGFKAAGEWLSEQRGIPGYAEHCIRLFEAGHRGRIFDEALLATGLPADSTLVAELVAAYRDHMPRLTLHADAKAFLDWAKARFDLALLTDGYAQVQRNKIQALGLERWISCIVVTDEMGRGFWKPHPAGFERIMATYPGAAAGFLYVGDNPGKDFHAPRHLGWQTARVARPGQEYGTLQAGCLEADCVIANFDELRELLQS